MIVGFNHNVNYRGVIFHVQTEDSGPQRPQLVTLLYQGGTIIGSKKTLYTDIIKVANLERVVEDLAKEQHKAMLRSLTRGEFDQRIAQMGISLAVPRATPVDDSAPEESSHPKTATGGDVRTAGSQPPPAPPITAVEPEVDKFRKVKSRELSLEELIYAYLTAGQR